MHGLHEALIHIFSTVPLSHPHMYAVVSTSYAMQYKDTFVYIQSADHVLWLGIGSRMLAEYIIMGFSFYMVWLFTYNFIYDRYIKYVFTNIG